WRMEISADGNASIIGVRRTEVLIFNFQVSKRFSLSYIYWENFFRIVLLDYNIKIHSLQISKSYVHSIKNVIQ
ncbi:MAG: hypothetical protein IKL31_00655, partial [Ruminococcus sp.]|nr:hypothetical protein [Ruminococcus sp.]